MSSYQHAPWIWLALLSAAFVGALSLYLWHRRSVRGARPLSVAMLIISAWCLAYAAQLAADDPAAERAWFLVGDALTLPAATAALWFALDYAGLERWLTRRFGVVLGAATVVLSSLYLVDGGRLVWSDLWTDGGVRGELAPLGIALSAYILVLALAATAVLLVLFIRSPAHRAPVLLILAGHVCLRVAYLLEVLDVSALRGLPTMVLAFDFTALMYTIALFRLRLFDLLPVARATIVERLPDALLVLDADDRVADANAAAERLLDVPLRADRRLPVAQVLDHYPELVARITAPEGHSAEATIMSPGGVRTLEVNSTALTDWQRRTIGRLVLIHDITALRAVETQLVEQERALATAQERERLARELHDGLAQDLWLAKLKVTRLAAQPELGAEARALSEEITAAVDAGIAEARQAVATMRGSSGTNGSLRELLARSLEDFEDRFGLAVEWECEAELPALPARTEVEALRIVGEALTNVRRHADATVVRVRGDVDDGGLVLEVRDNGRGFDPASCAAGSYGVAGMRERAAHIGGRLEIESAPQQGTRVRLQVPVVDMAAVEAGVG